MLRQLQALLEPFGLTHFYTGYGEASTRQLPSEGQSPGKRPTQQIERKHLTLWMSMQRLGHKSLGFSQSAQLHNIVISLVGNRYVCGRGCKRGHLHF